jgi:peptidoglycan/xylan/chitin deacetylase (PgdA/CDA1 family)
MTSKVIYVLSIFLLCFSGESNLKPFVTENAGCEVDQKQISTSFRRTVKEEVPILCYHNLTEHTNTFLTLSKDRFEAHMRLLHDSGYHSILPDELLQYLTTGKQLPSKPVLISFDDTRLAQYTIALPILEKYHFNAMFFIMTVCVDKPGYMSSAMLNDLLTKGNVIGSQTYDHPMINDIKENQWRAELEKPKLFLEKIIHEKVDYFGYPYGSWTKRCINELVKDEYKAAFQLSNKQSEHYPLYTIRRLMVQGNWSAATLHEKMIKTFH